MKESVELPEELHESIEKNFTDLIELDGWGNARDVNTVHDKMRTCRDLRCDDDGNLEGGYIQCDIYHVFHEMKKQRKSRRGESIVSLTKILYMLYIIKSLES